jgi:hypothetical protein
MNHAATKTTRAPRVQCVAQTHPKSIVVLIPKTCAGGNSDSARKFFHITSHHATKFFHRQGRMSISSVNLSGTASFQNPQHLRFPPRLGTAVVFLETAVRCSAFALNVARRAWCRLRIRTGRRWRAHGGEMVDNCLSSLSRKIAQGKKGNASRYCRGYVLPSHANSCKIFRWFRRRYVLQSLGNPCRKKLVHVKAWQAHL